MRKASGSRMGRVVALCIAAAAALAGCGSGEDAGGPDPAHVKETIGLFDDVPQVGNVLGAEGAPVTMTEFLDLECPHCRRYALDVMPTLVGERVRPGQVRLVMRLLAFVNADSEKAARMAIALGFQGRQWEFTHLYFEDQERQNRPATDEYLRELARAMPGVDVERAMADRHAEAVTRSLDYDRELAVQNDVRGTPSFLLGATGGPMQPFHPETLTPPPFLEAIDALRE